MRNNNNNKKFEHYIKEIIGKYDDNERDEIIDTPKRFLKALHELLTPKPFNHTTFQSYDYNEMIVDKDIDYYTLCEHHLLPFFGQVKIGYIPDGKIIGLSKLSRIVEYCSKRLNTQEYFTMNIANFINDNLLPKGVGVVVNGRHLCSEMRGVRKRNVMVTSCLRGIFLTEPRVKEEFLKL